MSKFGLKITPALEKTKSSEMATTYEFIFNEGPMGLQIDHDCLVEEIDVGEQASTCPDLKIGHLVTPKNTCFNYIIILFTHQSFNAV